MCVDKGPRTLSAGYALRSVFWLNSWSAQWSSDSKYIKTLSTATAVCSQQQRQQLILRFKVLCTESRFKGRIRYSRFWTKVSAHTMWVERGCSLRAVLLTGLNTHTSYTGAAKEVQARTYNHKSNRNICQKKSQLDIFPKTFSPSLILFYLQT